jgi:hypothetical protein
MTKLNYFMVLWFVLWSILEMADLETPNNRATSATGIPNSFTNRSALVAYCLAGSPTVVWASGPSQRLTDSAKGCRF